MKLIINSNKTIGQIQENFEEYFPFLMLQFYYPQAKHRHESSEWIKIKPDVPFKALNSNLDEIVIDFGGNAKTGDLEYELLKKMGIPVNIFRCQGESWIQTFANDNLSLDEENDLGQIAMEQWKSAESIWVEREKFL